jgi:hypothetical protein
VANLTIRQRQTRGRAVIRTFIRIAATPKSAQTRALLAKFKREVSAFGKKWKAAARRAKAAAARASKKKK